MVAYRRQKQLIVKQEGQEMMSGKISSIIPTPERTSALSRNIQAFHLLIIDGSPILGGAGLLERPAMEVTVIVDALRQ
jgi:hypothetical protein